jgi:hypothetical protein
MVLATTQKSGDANIMITDMAGKIIYNNTVTVSAGIVSESIQLDNVSGIYMVVVEFNGNQYHKQLVVSK